MLASTGWLRLFFLTFLDLAAHDFAVERERLKHDVEAAFVLVREHEADVEPVVVLALALDEAPLAAREKRLGTWVEFTDFVADLRKNYRGELFFRGHENAR